MRKTGIRIVIGLALLLAAAGCGDIVLPTEIPDEPRNAADTTSILSQPLSPDLQNH